MKTFFWLIGLVFCQHAIAQPLAQKLSKAVDQLQSDKQFTHAIISMYVVDGKTGIPVFERNAQVGLAPASCQKVITSAAAFELLGKNYQYKTAIKIFKQDGKTFVGIDASGDPTLGSWRWNTTKMQNVFSSIGNALKKKGVTTLSPVIFINQSKFSYQPIPDGWVWQDIGNYYGAGAWAFNWRENQYDLLLNSGKSEGEATTIKGFDPAEAVIPLENNITTGSKGSGDNAYIYAAPYATSGFTTGTIPLAQNNFSISGSMTDPSKVFIKGLKFYLNENAVSINDEPANDVSPVLKDAASSETILTILSPSFDSINLWFLKKSVNLFGEAFVKTIALEKTGLGSTDTGVSLIKKFWAAKGIEKSSLNITDGSGLSPANRVSTAALVAVIQFAKKQSWFPSFYNALPEMNGIKMKDGYIGGVRSYTGYVKSATGEEYSFAFIVNNFDGNPSTVREKIWKVLDLLK